MKEKEYEVAIIGLGYVGLPLAVAFAKKHSTFGFDVDETRLSELESGLDRTLELDASDILDSKNLKFTGDYKDIAHCNVFIVTVPTPINQHNQPDLRPLLRASKTVGEVLKSGDTVIYESTVFPGATEEECVPVLEHFSGLSFNKDFFVGYSPERINPGDKVHTVTEIIKVTSGSTPEAAREIDNLYSSVIRAGTYSAESIKVAEAAKVIENTQRDVNIGLINELALIFDRLNIDTEEVLKAAGTKWNFLPFRPGLVGGHCIGVDPYYLTHKAQSVGFHPEIILAGRRVNDGMGAHVASQVVKAMLKKRLHVHGASVLLLGLTFKENCPDIRNTKVVSLALELEEFGLHVDVYDPWVKVNDVRQTSVNLVDYPKSGHYAAVVIAVAHDLFAEMSIEKIKAFGKPTHVLYDLKYLLNKSDSDVRL